MGTGRDKTGQNVDGTWTGQNVDGTWTKVGVTKKKRKWKKMDVRQSLETLQRGLEGNDTRIPRVNRGFTQKETDELYEDIRKEVKYEK